MSTSTALAPAEQPRALALWGQQTTQEKIKALVPAGMSFDRFSRLTVSLLNRNPKLAECEPISFFACISDCAVIGVYPDPVTGQAYLIPRWNSQKNVTEATLLVGYKGLRSVALKSPEILDLWTGVVRKGDIFKLVRAPKQELIHEPLPEEMGEVIGYYSAAALKNGLFSYEWMPVTAVHKVRDEALSKLKDWQVKNSPWTLWEEEMGRKTALRRHFKSLPLRAEDQEAVQRDYDLDEDDVKRVHAIDDEKTTGEVKKLTRGTTPSRRGGAAAAKTEGAGPSENAGSIDIQSSQGAGAGQQAQSDPAASAASAAAPAPEGAKPETKTEQKPAAAVEKKAEPAPQPPEVCPGVSFAGFHGKAWPQLLRLEIVSPPILSVTPTGKAVLQLKVKTEGFEGDVVTFECIDIDSGTNQPRITKSFIAAGKFIEANCKAKLRPLPTKNTTGPIPENIDEKGQAKPNLAKAPAIFLENISEASAVEEF